MRRSRRVPVQLLRLCGLRGVTDSGTNSARNSFIPDLYFSCCLNYTVLESTCYIWDSFNYYLFCEPYLLSYTFHPLIVLLPSDSLLRLDHYPKTTTFIFICSGIYLYISNNGPILIFDLSILKTALWLSHRPDDHLVFSPPLLLYFPFPYPPNILYHNFLFY